MAVLCSNVKRGVSQSLGLLIDFLAFSSEDSNHIEIAVFARSPNMLERLLARVTLAQVVG